MHILLPLLLILGLLAPIVGLTQPEVEVALRGQVPVRIEPFARPDGKTAGRGIGAITIDRPMGEVWTTLIRFEDKAEYMPRIKSAEVLEKTRERLRVRMVLSIEAIVSCT
jgi:uncharacterized membrane protein